MKRYMTEKEHEFCRKLLSAVFGGDKLGNSFNVVYDGELLDEVNALVAELPYKNRVTVTTVLRDGKTWEEAGKRLGIKTEKTLKAHYAKGLRLLRHPSKSKRLRDFVLTDMYEDFIFTPHSCKGAYNLYGYKNHALRYDKEHAWNIPSDIENVTGILCLPPVVDISDKLYKAAIKQYERFCKAGTAEGKVAVGNFCAGSENPCVCVSGLSGYPLKEFCTRVMKELVAETAELKDCVEKVFYEVKSKREAAFSKLDTHNDNLEMVLGKDCAGNFQILDLAKDNLLIAGATGMGKTTLIYSALASILNKCELVICGAKYNFEWLEKPDTVSFYEITSGEPSEAIEEILDLSELVLALRKCVKSTEKFKDTVLIVDEYAFLKCGSESERLERAMTDLVKHGKEYGIHVILSTQRPVEEVISTELKEAFSCKAAFHLGDGGDYKFVLGDFCDKQGKMMVLKDGNVSCLRELYFSPEIIIAMHRRLTDK